MIANRSQIMIALIAVLCGAVPAWADVIRFGTSGSIFGGATWDIRPDDRVVYAAYQATGPVTRRPEWVWDNKGMRAGHITFVVSGAYETASDIINWQIGQVGLGPVAPRTPDCTDEGRFEFTADIAGLTFVADLDGCVQMSETAPSEAKAQFAALQAIADRITVALRLDRLLAP